VRFVEGSPVAPLVTKREIAAELGVTERTIERWMHKGLPFLRLRNGWPRFEVVESRAWQLRPVESRRLLRAVCAGCGREGHVDQHLADIASLVCRACGEPLVVDGCGR